MVARTLTVEQVAALRIPTADEMLAVASSIPQIGAGTWQAHDTRPGVFLEVGPGLVRIFRTAAHVKDAAADRELARRKGEQDYQRALENAVYREPMTLVDERDIARLDKRKQGTVRGSRGVVVGWSRRSRARMQMQLNRIDFTPLFEDGLEPAMVTLTLPGDWESVAPTPAAFKAAVNRFRTAYRNSWGESLAGVWKMEFQKRGAPHLHILMTPPAGTAGFGGLPMDFRRWLSHAWVRACKTQGPEAERHLRAGTGIDYVGDAYRDPRRIAAYFGKHGFFSGKEYQNRMPQLWLDAVAAGEPSANFWGVWSLKKASVVLRLDDAGAASVETMIDPLGVSEMGRNITEHYRGSAARTDVLDEERQTYATDASVLRAAQRRVDEAGTSSPDDVIVRRHMRKLSRSLAMRGAQLVRNKHGQLVLDREDPRIRRVTFEAADRDTGELRRRRRYRIGYYEGRSGFLLVPDGRRAGRDIQRLLDRRGAWGLVA